MKLKFTIILSLLLFYGLSKTEAQESLPKWMTKEEKAVFQQYLNNLPEGKSTQPPAEIPRTPAEFEEMQGVIITWTSYTQELREIVRNARQHVTVYIVCSSPSYVQSYLTSGDVPLDNIVFVQAQYDSVWIRDYGPQSIYLADGNQLAFVDWVYNRPRPDDDLIPGVMAGQLGVPIFQMTSNPYRLITTGGNFMSDGHGNGYSSDLILSENPYLSEEQIDNIMHMFMGIDNYIKMPSLPYDNIHHLDMHMKLLDEETLLVGEFPEGVSDGPYIEQNLENLLNNHNSCFGSPYEVVRIPMVPDNYGQYPPSAAYRTYTNAIILNGLVLLPVYGHYLDEEAIQIYQEALPGYTVVGINSQSIIPASGAIHCITREIAAEDPIFISHARIRDTLSTNDNALIKAVIKNHSGISEAKVFWTNDPEQEFSSIDMSLQTDTFYAEIPAQNCPGTIYYYISATNQNNKTITKPIVAPEGFYSVSFDGEVLDILADKQVVEIEETVSFSMELCSGEIQTADWDFGEGAYPATAQGEGPHEVYYSSSGHKTVSLTVNGDIAVEKENIVLVNDPENLFLLVSVQGEGTTTPEAGSYTLPYGSTQELSATAAQGWVFRHWIITGTDDPVEQANISITMEENMTATAVFQNTSSIAGNFRTNELKFSIFPNPAKEIANLFIAPSGLPIWLSLTNIHGQVLYNETIPGFNNEIKKTINTATFPSGIYFIKLSNGIESTTQKLIIH